MTQEVGKGDREYGVTDKPNGNALHQQQQGRGRAKQVLLSHPNMEVTETGQVCSQGPNQGQNGVQHLTE